MSRLKKYATRIARIRESMEADLEKLRDSMENMSDQGTKREKAEEDESKLEDMISTLEQAEMDCED